jgi:hypothetical protein
VAWGASPSFFLTGVWFGWQVFYVGNSTLDGLHEAPETFGLVPRAVDMGPALPARNQSHPDVKDASFTMALAFTPYSSAMLHDVPAVRYLAPRSHTRALSFS